jgi:hypothetical protein
MCMLALQPLCGRHAAAADVSGRNRAPALATACPDQPLAVAISIQIHNPPQAVHNKEVDANLLAEFVSCPVLLLP